jgi:SAM-dependent methyltransferase
MRNLFDRLLLAYRRSKLEFDESQAGAAVSLSLDSNQLKERSDMTKEPIRSLLRSPRDLRPLVEASDGKCLTAPDGRTYPIYENGILCLLDEDERGLDLGDGCFYDRHPFGERDWANRADIEQGVEPELKEMLKTIPRDALIADVGCGTGRISNYLSLVDFENVASIDISLVSLSVVSSSNSKTTCLLANNLHLPIKAEAFDLVISSGVIHHTPSPAKSLQELARIMKAGGILYLKVYNLHSLYGYLYYTYGAVLRLMNSVSVTKKLADILGFDVYRMVRSILPLPRRSLLQLRSKYEGLFLKRMVHFYTTAEIRGQVLKNGLDVVSESKRGATHRMHSYVARKKNRDN